jgi:two-component system, sensor histidine kinase and response regulator
VAEGESGGSPPRVLVADDDEGCRRFLSAVLEGHGVSAVLVGGGAEALATFAREPFVLVLLDLRMPGMDGLATATALRTHERASGGRVPILAMSGDSDEATVVRCRAAGIDGHIAKPVRYRELIERIEQMVGVPPIGASAAPEGVGPGALHPRLAGLADRFLADALRLGGEISLALSRRDAVALRTAAHQLYGSAGLFQAERARTLAHRLEERADAGDFSAASEELARQLTAELAALERQLRRLRPAS